MKMLDSIDSMDAYMSICPTPAEDNSPRLYGREFQSMLDGLDEDGCVDELGGHVPEKKRRLSMNQVKALEKNFEIENKLEPERKIKLAQDLGLQPRQVAVWFQNRRARWKTKQLERDYGALKASYEALKLNFESLQVEKEGLVSQVSELKLKLKDDKNSLDIKDEAAMVSESEQNKLTVDGNNSKQVGDLKDTSDSDSSAILNEERSPIVANSSARQEILMNSSSEVGFYQKCYQPQFVKMEHNFFGVEEEPCNFFSDEQAPTLQWYSSETWG